MTRLCYRAVVRAGRKFPIFILILFFALVNVSEATSHDLVGKWFAAEEGWTFGGQKPQLDTTRLEPVAGVALTGGNFVHQADFIVGEAGRHVVDFKNTSIIGKFRHFVFDSDDRLIASMEGGISSTADNPFFLRHGRELYLPQGQYRLITQLSSPFFLAQPEPYLDDLEHYRDAVKPGNALTLMGIGVFLGLGIYYAALSLSRRRVAEGMYALFILGNILFNGTALLVFSELFGLQWIYLASVPILLSNAAYIVFVMCLLEIRRDNHPALYRGGMAVLGLLGMFILAGVLMPHWSLELARYGVGLFLSYGLIAGIIRTRQGNVSARFYLVAIAVFFVLGSAAISLGQLAGVYTMYIEHVGLLAVAVEVILLALVLAYQFGQVHREREYALEKLKHSTRMARTDALTGLANRFALDLDLDGLPDGGSLTFLDLDNLKYYNDLFGHEKGDELLRTFACQLSERLENKGRVYRVGGDEFAIISEDGNIADIEQAIAETTLHIQTSGFGVTGASAGTAFMSEVANTSELKRTADLRMYEVKREHKQTYLLQQQQEKQA